ncbi:hypothetical protein [Salinicola aestuarinus]|uniref:hypothetical protein n=1 Tax=Salinicola aestuarinus TaxID=1949082 RepID=UPI001300A958|nr:hypothetical protein [Salinicola aestuarinus]
MIYNNTQEIRKKSKKFMYQGILGTTALAYGTGAVAQGWEQVDKKELVLNKASQSDEAFDLTQFIQDGRTKLNNDKGAMSSETRLTAEEVATSPMTQLTKNEPVVMGMFDGANDLGTIQVISMKRHPDGSATLYQKFFTPYDFDPKSEGGTMSRASVDILENRYGGNPFEDFKSDEEEYKNSFIKIKPYGLQTAMGLAMQHYQSTTGIYVFLEPQVRVWTTTSGGPFRKKVTTHVEAHFKPHWGLLTPSDIGNDMGTVGKPFYVLANGKTVISGASLHEGSCALNPHYGDSPDEPKYLSTFACDRVKVFYDKKSKSGWTGIAIIAVGIAVGMATGGFGLAGTKVMGALYGGMAFAGYGAINGNTNFTEVSTTSIGNVTAISDTRSLEKQGDWAMKWKNVMRDRVNEGPLDSKLDEINESLKKEKDNWELNTIEP